MRPKLRFRPLCHCFSLQPLSLLLSESVRLECDSIALLSQLRGHSTRYHQHQLNGLYLFYPLLLDGGVLHQLLGLPSHQRSQFANQLLLLFGMAVAQ